MGTLMISTVAILICAVLVGWLLRKRAKRLQLPWLHLFPGATTRKLSDDERQGVENYLDELCNTCQWFIRKQATKETSKISMMGKAWAH